MTNLDETDIEARTAGGELISPVEAVFERWRRRVGIVLAPAAFAGTYVLASGLTAPGRKLSAILAAVAVLWLTETLPLPVTALLAAVLCIVLGVADAKSVLAPFADPIVFLFIGSFMLARAMTIHRLDRRIAIGFLSLPWLGASPGRVMAGMGAITALISMWVSNTATTAMMLPIALGVLGALHQVRIARGLASGPMNARAWPFATGMMLMVAYAASIGGIGTPVGSPPNLIGIGLIREATGRDIPFFRWMALAVPMLVVMAGALFVLLYLLHPAERKRAGSTFAAKSTADDLAIYLREEREKLGAWSTGQINTLVAFAVAVVLWVTPGFLAVVVDKTHAFAALFDARVPEAAAALVASVLLFILPTNLRHGTFTLSWDQATRIDWGTILLFGGGLSLGGLMFKTGVADALGREVTGLTGAQSLWALTAATIALGIILSEATSNTASANMLVPVAIALASAAGVSPIPPALGAVFGASFGFMLPVSTPPNAIAYGSGLVPIPRMIRAGAVFDVLGFAIIWCGLRVLCPVMGLM